ncbi:MAG: hypothetical protein ACJ79P_15915 [Myxococcales bacterium]
MIPIDPNRAFVVSAVLLAALFRVGAGALLSARACLVPAALVTSLPAGSDVLVVTPGPDWRAIAALAAAPPPSPPPDGMSR